MPLPAASSADTSFETLRMTTRYWLLGRGYKTAHKALEFAAKYHDGVRKDGSPEFSHQMWQASYARTLADMLIYPEETIATTFLHDVLEDYPVRPQEITDIFGSRIGDATLRMSKIVGGHKLPNDMYFEKLAECPIASVAKGIDRLHNHKTMVGAFDAKKQAEYIDETRTTILPMLKAARRTFSEQEPVYENIKLMLLQQMDLYYYAHSGGPMLPSD